MIRSGDELAAIARIQAILAEREDPALARLLGRLLIRVGKEVEGSALLDAWEEVGAVERGLERLLLELEDLPPAQEDEPDPGPDP